MLQVVVTTIFKYIQFNINNFDRFSKNIYYYFSIHFSIFIKTKIILQLKKIKRLSRLSIHRKINKLLEEEFLSGLHALEIKFKY